MGLISKAMFEAPFWAILINPHFLPRRALWQAMQDAASDIKGTIADVGCGTQPYRRLLSSADLVVGLEVGRQPVSSSKRVDLMFDGRSLPFGDGKLDGVLLNQVLEHVFEPGLMLAEINRVLKVGGKLFLSVPFVWPEHEQPLDSQRFTSFGIAFRLKEAGFDVVRSRKLVPGIAALCAILADNVNSRIRGAPRLLRVAVRVFAIAPVSLVGFTLAKCSRSDAELYLDNFVVAKKS